MAQTADGADDRHRLEIELEFVQCLANPFYLTHLAHLKALDDERFLNYIDYLEYFRKPEYARLLTYPVYSLSALTLLKQPQFRQDIANPAIAQEMMRDMVASFVPPNEELNTSSASSATAAAAAAAAAETAQNPAAPPQNGDVTAGAGGAGEAAASGANANGTSVNLEKRNGVVA